VSIPGVDARSFYYNKNYVHVHNEHIYTVNDCAFIFDQLQVDVPSEHRRKYVQFVVIFHLLTHGRHMTNYENLKDLFQLLKVESVSKMHWSDTSGWRMVDVMHVVLLEVPKVNICYCPLLLQLMLMKSPRLITHSGCQSIYMWCKNGGAFSSSYVLRQ
jgi:hypothetical protein